MPNHPPVISQKGALVGDENVADVVEPEITVNEGDDTAQVAPEREAAAGSVVVHETHVATDQVITDPSSPEAVQIPDAGRGPRDLPAHTLAGDTPEDVFAKDASKAKSTPKDTSTPKD